MAVRIDIVVLLNFMVNFLLLSGTDRLCGFSSNWRKLLLASLIGGIYGGACLLPGFGFLGNIIWRLIFIFLLASIAFGWSRSIVRRSAMFLVLTMALEGIALGFGESSYWQMLFGAVLIMPICVLGLSGGFSAAKYVQVKVPLSGRMLQFTALCDTGNVLRDPITGRTVLVVGSEIAGQLTGLTPQQLRTPSETIVSAGMPGLRLIPFRAVGRPNGLMLGMRVRDVTIGSWKGNTLVAFAPDVLSTDGVYQALTGGTI